MTTPQQPPGQTPAGWYPDPAGSGRQRYWDGSAWTEHYADGQPAQAAPSPGPQAGPGPGPQAGPGPGPQPGFGAPDGPAQPQLGSPPTATLPPTHPALIAAGVSALLMIIGGFGPWAKVLDLVTVNGTEGDGWIVIALALICAGLLFAFTRTGLGWMPIVAAALAGLSALVTIIDLADISSMAEGFGDSDADLVDASWGIYLALIASLGMAGAAIALRAASRRGS